MPTSYTSLLGLALPVTGELSGTWGDTVNDYITKYVDASVAGTQTISGSQTAVTLSTTTNATLSQVGTGATGSAQYSVINCTGNPAGLLTITAPAQSKTYLIINATSTSQSVKIVGTGPTTGVTLIAGERALVAWNGSDFIKVATTAAAGGSNTQVQFNSSGVLAGSANMTFNGTTLTVNDLTDSSLTTGRVVYTGTGGNLLSSANLLYSGTDLTVYGITVGRGAGAVSTNTAVGASALAANTTGSSNAAFGNNALLDNTSGAQLTALGQAALQSNTSGVDNTAVGFRALQLNTTGGYNTAVGRQALLSNTTASNNTAVGYQAGYSGTTQLQQTVIGYQAGYSGASYQTAVGYQALYSNISASSNDAFGWQSLYANTTGASSVGFGTWSLAANTTGSFNTALGKQALYSNISASNNTAVGYQAGYSNTTGYITAVGASALRANTTGSGNVAVGGTVPGSYNAALYANTTGSNNAAFGGAALVSNTTGSSNTAIGIGALLSNTTASDNTAVGYQAGYSNTTGGITAFGFEAGLSNTTGANNNALGYRALRSNTTGTNNTAVGTAIFNNTTGSFNTAVGWQALDSNTTASNNTAVGYQAGYSTTTGGVNAFFGNTAGYSATTGVGNTFIGQNAGYSVTTGIQNTFVGHNTDGTAAGYYVTTGNKNTILGGYNGNQGGLDIRTASNYIVLSDGDGNPRQYYDGGTTNAWWMNAPVIIKNGAVPTPSSGAATSTSIGGTGNQITVGINGQSNGEYGTLLIQARKGDSSDPLVMAQLNYGGIALRGASPQTAGIGITFPATQSASSDANTLDDYEEGTWTPTVAGYNSSPTVTYTSQSGTYTKVGRQVTVSFKIVVNTSSGGSGEILVSGLPFAASGEHVATMLSSGIDFGTSATQLTGRTEGAAWIRLYGMFNNGALVSTAVSTVAAGDTVQGTLTYFV